MAESNGRCASLAGCAQASLSFWLPGVVKKSEEDPDTQWKKQQQAQETNEVYKFVDFSVSIAAE